MRNFLKGLGVHLLALAISVVIIVLLYLIIKPDCDGVSMVIYVFFVSFLCCGLYAVLDEHIDMKSIKGMCYLWCMPGFCSMVILVLMFIDKLL